MRQGQDKKPTAEESLSIGRQYATLFSLKTDGDFLLFSTDTFFLQWWFEIMAILESVGNILISIQDTTN